MKFRNDFVTNSSSSSFIIAKKNLDEEQLEAIRNHSVLGAKLGILYADEAWNIEENEEFIAGDTSMDNFDFAEFLKVIEVSDDVIAWGEWPFDLDAFVWNEKEKEMQDSGWRDIFRSL